jgi:hypothetical protein
MSGITDGAKGDGSGADGEHCDTSSDPLGSTAQPTLESLSGDGMQVTPIARSSSDSRVVAAWCEWLDALGTNAEAALAAAMAYKELDADARDTWLSALDQDAPQLKVPRIAVYAPLLAVESDPDRRARISAAIGPGDVGVTPSSQARALSGSTKAGLRVAAIVTPLYLDFVQVLACGYRPTDGFEWVRHDPIVLRRAAPQNGDQLEGVSLENTPMKPLIDELAHTVLAHGRSGRAIPEALRVFADLFGPAHAGESSKDS